MSDVADEKRTRLGVFGLGKLVEKEQCKNVLAIDWDGMG